MWKKFIKNYFVYWNNENNLYYVEQNEKFDKREFNYSRITM